MTGTAASIGVPSVGGMKGAFTDFAVGAGGGLAFKIGQSIFGGNLLGFLVPPLLAGSVIKGERGRVIATMAGFMALAQGIGGTVSADAAGAGDGVNNEVM